MAEDTAATETTENHSGDSGTGITESVTGLTAPPAWSDEEMGGQSSTTTKESSEGLTDTGSPGTAKGKKEEEGKADPAQVAADKAKADADAKAKEESGNEGGEDGGDIKPPKGFVPVEALKQQKSAVKYFKSKISESEATIADLQKQLAERPMPGKLDEFKDFKVLTDDEIDELADDDPVAAAKYVKDLRKFEKAQEETAKEKKTREAREEEDAINLHEANDRIKSALVVDGKSIQEDLAKFAAENGFPEELFILTDPTTQIIVNGQNGPRKMTTDAATMVEFLAKMMNSHKNPTKEAITIDNVPDDVREAIIAAAQDKIIGKVRKGAKPRSISDIPSSSQDDGTGKFKGKSYAELSPAEREEYLKS